MTRRNLYVTLYRTLHFNYQTIAELFLGLLTQTYLHTCTIIVPWFVNL